MKPPAETFHATNGSNGARGSLPVGRIRLALLALMAALGSLLVIWVSHTTWQRVDGLQAEFAGLKADNFYLGVRVRSDIQRLNDTLLRYRLRGDTNDAEAFRADAQVFEQWLAQNQTNSSSPVSRAFFEQVRAAYQDYLTASTAVLSR